MKSSDDVLNEMKELSTDDVALINGGGFAYDAGFFLRELWVYATSGAQAGGAVAVAADLGANYRPTN